MKANKLMTTPYKDHYSQNEIDNARISYNRLIEQNLQFNDITNRIRAEMGIKPYSEVDIMINELERMFVKINK